jgi:hypothetical protein
MNVRTLQRLRMNWKLAALFLLLTAGTALAAGEQRRLEATLYDYSSTFRWGDIGQILSFMDKSDAAAKAPTTFEVERWKQWRVVGYRSQPYVMSSKERAEQVVEIEISNINTQATRKLIDRQRWRYERKSKTWLLSSGLPNLAQP